MKPQGLSERMEVSQPATRPVVIKVFEVNDVEWWAGESREAVVREICEQLSCEDDDELKRDGMLYQDGPVELSPNAMRVLAYTDDDGSGRAIKRSFFSQLRKLIKSGQQFPCLFATTER